MWWDYANNPSGGFWWYAFSKLPLTDKNFIYMQLEQSKARLCFKVNISDESVENDRRQIRYKLFKLFISEARKEGFFEIKKPKKFGKGKTMTFAVVEREGWFGNDKLDRDVVISDDGLQHVALPRRLELVMMHPLGLGNGRCLPAGPLREPAERLAYSDRKSVV